MALIRDGSAKLLGLALGSLRHERIHIERCSRHAAAEAEPDLSIVPSLRLSPGGAAATLSVRSSLTSRDSGSAIAVPFQAIELEAG